MSDDKVMPADPLGERDIHEVLNKDPEKYYRWVEPSKVNTRQAQGYRPVEKDAPEVGGTHLSPEGYRMVGRKVLMACPRWMRSAREKKAHDLDRRRKAELRERFHSYGDKIGIQTFNYDRVPKRGGGHVDVETPGAPGRKPTFAMGAGIDPETGEVVRHEAPPPQRGGRRTMREEISDKDEREVDVVSTDE